MCGRHENPVFGTENFRIIELEDLAKGSSSGSAVSSIIGLAFTAIGAEAHNLNPTTYSLSTD